MFVILEAIPIFLEKDEEKKAKLVEAFESETLPPFIQKLEYILSSNGGQYYVGNQVKNIDFSQVIL